MSLEREAREDRVAGAPSTLEPDEILNLSPRTLPPESSEDLTRRAVAMARERILLKAALAGRAR